MSDRELMQQALEALTAYDGTNGVSQRKRVLAALRERLAQPEQELVCVCGAIWEGQELVSTPPPRQWQGLTEQEIKDCEKQAMVNGSLPFEQRSFFARAIEAKLKEKNG